MSYPRSIDLHMHTTVSDGTDTPREILARVREAGLELFSVTDHDAVKGSRILRDLRRDGAPRFLSGVEFSCRDEEGKYHILGYGYDPDAEGILRVVELGHRYRMNKTTARLECLKKEFNVSFPEEEVRRLLAMDNPGKPHIGNLMVKYGYAPTKEAAITQYIDRLSLRPEYVRPEEAIRGILAAGGIPILAHPTFGSGGQRIQGEAMDRRLRRLMDCGLRGLEAFYSGFTEAIRAELLAFAEKYGLYVTAGSDYHGTNKRIALGETGLSGAAAWPAGLTRFLENVGVC